jgi:hypothetical protein
LSQESQFIYIYRRGKGYRATRLYREQDWQTGLSFSVEPFSRGLKFSVEKLRQAGYAVRFDADELIYTLFTNEPFVVEGVQKRFGENHVTVYLPNKSEWDAWYQAELAIEDPTDGVSEQTLKLFELQEKE